MRNKKASILKKKSLKNLQKRVFSGSEDIKICVQLFTFDKIETKIRKRQRKTFFWLNSGQ